MDSKLVSTLICLHASKDHICMVPKQNVLFILKCKHFCMQETKAGPGLVWLLLATKESFLCYLGDQVFRCLAKQEDSTLLWTVDRERMFSKENAI